MERQQEEGEEDIFPQAIKNTVILTYQQAM